MAPAAKAAAQPFPIMRPDELFSIFRPRFIPQSSNDLMQKELAQEFFFWLAIVLLALLFLWLRPAFFKKLEARGRDLSRKRGWVVAFVILASLALRAALLLVLPIPEPTVHDEYSYLLQAQTFASGRLTNPTPAGWEHLEAFHVNMQPTYQSMYPPGQALFLAAADVLHIHAWWGVWLSVGLLCGAVCWMLQGWMPPQWALLGGLFCVLRFSTFSYWMNSYFGGAVAALGGALVLGSLPRLKRNPRPRYGLLFALGLAILANTRMYEGFIFSLPALAALALWFFPAWKRGRIKLAILAPAVMLLLSIGAAMGYYNRTVTGSPLKLPYVLNQEKYHITKPFIWQARYPIPEYRHQVMRTFYVIHELPDYLRRKDPEYLLDNLRQRAETYYDFYIWPMMALTIFALWSMAKSAKMRIFPITLVLLLAGVLIEQWLAEAHYAAPILAATIAVVLYGLRMTWTWRPKGIPVGAMLVRSAVILLFVQCILATGTFVLDPYRLEGPPYLIPEVERARLMSELERIPGEHLVFLHLHFTDRGVFFWIYNEPDVARSRIIWAHDMGDAENRQFMKMYPNRHVWLIDKDNATNRLVAYPGLGEGSGSSHADVAKPPFETPLYLGLTMHPKDLKTQDLRH